VLELALRQRAHDRCDRYEQGQRGDQTRGVVHDALKVYAGAHAEHHGRGDAGAHDDHLRPEARRRGRDREDHPGKRGTGLTAAERCADGEHR
jgi:hypothetical protein